MTRRRCSSNRLRDLRGTTKHSTTLHTPSATISSEIEYQQLEIQLNEKYIKEYNAALKVKKQQAEEAEAVEVPVEEAAEEAPEVIVAEHEPVAAEEDFAE